MKSQATTLVSICSVLAQINLYNRIATLHNIKDNELEYSNLKVSSFFPHILFFVRFFTYFITITSMFGSADTDPRRFSKISLIGGRCIEATLLLILNPDPDTDLPHQAEIRHAS